MKQRFSGKAYDCISTVDCLRPRAGFWGSHSKYSAAPGTFCRAETGSRLKTTTSFPGEISRRAQSAAYQPCSSCHDDSLLLHMFAPCSRQPIRSSDCCPILTYLGLSKFQLRLSEETQFSKSILAPSTLTSKALCSAPYVFPGDSGRLGNGLYRAHLQGYSAIQGPKIQRSCQVLQVSAG